MEAGGGCGNGAFFAGEGGLVAVAVGDIAFTVHVMGQGESTVGFLVDGAVPTDDAVAVFQDFGDSAGGVADLNRAAGFHFFARAHETFPLELSEFVGADEFDFSVVGEEAGGGDFGVVEHDEVIVAQVAGEIGKHPVFDLTGVAVHDHHA